MKTEYVIIAFLALNTVLDILFKRISLLSCAVMLLSGGILLMSDKGRVFVMGEEYSLWIFMAGALFGCILMIVSFASGGSIGMGDGAVAAACGLYMGIYRVVFVFLIAFTLSGILGGLLVVLKRATKKTRLVFMPFVFVSYLCLYLSGAL